MTVGALAAASATVVLAGVTMVLGWSALRAQGEWLHARAKADRSLSIGDRRGHVAARTEAALLRRQARASCAATLTSTALMVIAAVVATV